MQTTIFFGNGINLLGKGDSWDSILMQLSEGKMMPPIGSNTLKYEYVVLKNMKLVPLDLISGLLSLLMVFLNWNQLMLNMILLRKGWLKNYHGVNIPISLIIKSWQTCKQIIILQQTMNHISKITL